MFGRRSTVCVIRASSGGSTEIADFGKFSMRENVIEKLDRNTSAGQWQAKTSTRREITRERIVGCILFAAPRRMGKKMPTTSCKPIAPTRGDTDPLLVDAGESDECEVEKEAKKLSFISRPFMVFTERGRDTTSACTTVILS